MDTQTLTSQNTNTMNVLLAVIVGLFLVSAAQAYVCTFEDTTMGVHYNLSALTNDKHDYECESHDRDGNTLKYWMNPCRPTITQLCGPNCATCQQWDPTREDGKASLGSTLQATAVAGTLPEQKANGGFSIDFTGGTNAQSGQPRSETVFFICDRSVSVGLPKFVDENPSLHFNFEWRSKEACVSEAYTCRYVDPATGAVYDLSALNTHEDVTFPCGESTCWLSPCNHVQKPCAAGATTAGICQATAASGLYSLGAAKTGTPMQGTSSKQVCVVSSSPLS
jgi:Cation-independent mannose-6-phosphate receptor repeat